jgi:hypothetical protein
VSLARWTNDVWARDSRVLLAYAHGPLAHGREPPAPVVDLAVLMSPPGTPDEALLSELRTALSTDALRVGDLDTMPPHLVLAILQTGRLLACRDRGVWTALSYRTMSAAFGAHVADSAARTIEEARAPSSGIAGWMSILRGRMREMFRCAAGIRASRRIRIVSDEAPMTSTAGQLSRAEAAAELGLDPSLSVIDAELVAAGALRYYVWAGIRAILDVGILLLCYWRVPPPGSPERLFPALKDHRHLDADMALRMGRWLSRLPDLEHGRATIGTDELQSESEMLCVDLELFARVAAELIGRATRTPDDTGETAGGLASPPPGRPPSPATPCDDQPCVPLPLPPPRRRKRPPPEPRRSPPGRDRRRPTGSRGSTGR